MNTGGIISMIGYLLLGAAAAILVIAYATSWMTAGVATATHAAAYCGIAGAMLILMGTMMTQRENDRKMKDPPALAQPGGYQNPVPGGTIPGNPNAGWRPNPGQIPPYGGKVAPQAGPIPPYGVPPDYPGAPPPGGRIGRTFERTVTISDTFTETKVRTGGPAGPKEILAVERGTVQVAVTR